MAILDLLDLKSIMGCPGGMSEHNPIYSFSIYTPFSGQFFFKFS